MFDGTGFHRGYLTCSKRELSVSRIWRSLLLKDLLLGLGGPGKRLQGHEETSEL